MSVSCKMLLFVAMYGVLASATSAGVNISSLAINAGPSKESKIVLGDADEAFTLALQADGSLVIRHRNEPTFTVDPSGAVTVPGTLRSKGAMRIDGTVNYMGVQQWFLVAIEDFSEGTAGWSNSSTSTCGNPDKVLLGGCGHFAGGEVSKVYSGLPPHDAVRVKANYHFIDAWGGETAYAKIQNQYVWSDSLDQQTVKHGLNLCCGDAPESRTSTPIDVTMPHSENTVDVTFGSTLTLSPSEQSWAISDVQVYIRSTV